MRQPLTERKQYHPVKVIGKQPNHNVWVFNEDVQMDVNGMYIPINERRFMLDGKRKDHLINVSADLDDGESLRNLLQAEKELFGNNFPQVLMAHATSSLCANFDLTIETFDGCGIPVLIGHPVSGKSTALKAVLSVFGDNSLVNNATKKYIESRQAATSVPFGWDDVSDPKLLGEIAVSSFNQAGSASVRGEHKPHTVPLVTTNLDSGQLKVKSRWFRIQFEELSPKLKGSERCQKEISLKTAMKTASKSISVVTSHIHKCIVGISDGDNDFQEMESFIEEACSTPSLSEIDHRAQRQFAVMLFCCKKILDAVNMPEDFDGVKEKVITVILPSYMKGGTSEVGYSAKLAAKASKVEMVLHDKMLKVLGQGNKEEVLGFFDQDFMPQCCGCGEVVTFHVSSLLNYLLAKGCEEAVGVTEYSIRYYIKKNEIGCVGRQVKFRHASNQVSAAHIRRDWFEESDIHVLDACLGKRKKSAPRGGTKSKALPTKSTSTKDTTEVLDEPQSMVVNIVPKEVDTTEDTTQVLDEPQSTSDDIALIEADITDDALQVVDEPQSMPVDTASTESDADSIQVLRDVPQSMPVDATSTEGERTDADKFLEDGSACSSVYHKPDLPSSVEGERNKMGGGKSLTGRKRDVTSKLKDTWNDGKGVAGKRSRKQAKH